MAPPSSQPQSETDQSAALTTQKTRTKRLIWEVVAEIGAQIPDEKWAKLPDDGAVNYKHYLYGATKQDGAIATTANRLVARRNTNFCPTWASMRL